MKTMWVRRDAGLWAIQWDGTAWALKELLDNGVTVRKTDIGLYICSSSDGGMVLVAVSDWVVCSPVRGTVRVVASDEFKKTYMLEDKKTVVAWGIPAEKAINSLIDDLIAEQEGLRYEQFYSIGKFVEMLNVVISKIKGR